MRLSATAIWAMRTLVNFVDFDFAIRSCAIPLLERAPGRSSPAPPSTIREEGNDLAMQQATRREDDFHRPCELPFFVAQQCRLQRAMIEAPHHRSRLLAGRRSATRSGGDCPLHLCDPTRRSFTIPGSSSAVPDLVLTNVASRDQALNVHCIGVHCIGVHCIAKATAISTVEMPRRTNAAATSTAPGIDHVPMDRPRLRSRSRRSTRTLRKQRRCALTSSGPSRARQLDHRDW